MQCAFRRPVFRSLLFCLIIGFISAAWAQDAGKPTDIVLKAKVRDFKEVNPTDTVGVDSMFNNQNGCSAREEGLSTVQYNIDTTNSMDGGTLPGDNRGPKLVDPVPNPMARCYNPPARFPEWFQDRSPDINRPFLVDLHFQLDTATGLYRFASKAFFPIDSADQYTKIHPTDPDPFGHLDTGMMDGKDLSKHNYGFTVELHTLFTYNQGKHQVLAFQGDDDIWVFLNGKLAVDLGGVHPTDSESVDLDSAQTILGLVDGQSYPLDFFFAERHVASSTVLISTSLGAAALAAPVRPRAPALQAAQASDFEIYDRAGRLVKRVHAQGTGAANAQPLWDGLDAGDRPAAPGLYLWRAVSGPRATGNAGTLVRMR